MGAVGPTMGLNGRDGIGTIIGYLRYQTGMVITIFGKVRVAVTW